jgi:glycosyltransferase involved in cell wall biosynthesis
LFYHGTITEDRGVGHVIEAVGQLTGRYREAVTLTIVGDGPALQQMKALATKLNIGSKVRFTGLVAYEAVPDLIAQADCCICPLPDRPEWRVSSPLKVFEYMSCGKPIILTPIDAHKDVADGLGFVVWTDGYAIEDYRRAIERAYDSAERLYEAATDAPRFAREHFEWTIQGSRFAEYLMRTFS